MSDSREVMDTRNDPYAAYGAKVGTTGQFMSFKNGEFLAGQDQTEIPIGTKLVAFMPGLRIGWRRWFAGVVTDDLTLPLADGPTIERRDQLGDMDQSQWERDDAGKPRDPWQLTNILEMSDGTETYIYSTGSKGGINAIGRLCRDYGRERRQRPGMLPIITLGRDSYNHPTYKKVYVPDFKIVGWTDENEPSVEDIDMDEQRARADRNEPLSENVYMDRNGDVQMKPGQRAVNPTLAAEQAASSNSTTKSPSSGARRAPRPF